MNWDTLENKDIRLKYQDIYIRSLENELFRRSSREEMRSLGQEEIECDYNPTWRYKIKMESLKKTVEELFQTRREIHEDELSFHDWGSHPIPYQWTLPRVAIIKGSEDGLLRKQVILRYEGTEKTLGMAMYLPERSFKSDMLGLLIEKFFMDMCHARIKEVTGASNA